MGPRRRRKALASRIRKALWSYGCPSSAADIDALFDKWDADHDGVLSLLEIHSILRHGGTLRVSKALRSKPITQREINDLTQLPALGQLDKANQSSSQKSTATFNNQLHLRQAPASPGRSYAAATKCGICTIGPCTCKAKLKRFQRTASILNKARLSFVGHAMGAGRDTSEDLLRSAQEAAVRERSAAAAPPAALGSEGGCVESTGLAGSAALPSQQAVFRRGLPKTRLLLCWSGPTRATYFTPTTTCPRTTGLHGRRCTAKLHVARRCSSRW